MLGAELAGDEVGEVADLRFFFQKPQRGASLAARQVIYKYRRAIATVSLHLPHIGLKCACLFIIKAVMSKLGKAATNQVSTQ